MPGPRLRNGANVDINAETKPKSQRKKASRKTEQTGLWVQR